MSDRSQRAAEAATVRLAAHLFLTRRGVRFLLTHALRVYQPSLRLRQQQQQQQQQQQAPQSPAALFHLTYGQLVEVILRGPCDLVLWGKGDMALTPGASRDQARWLHWFNLFGHEDALDSTLAINMQALVPANLGGALLAFYELFGHCEEVWRLRENASIYAEQRFGDCCHRHVLKALYPRGYILVELLTALLRALLDTVPPTLHETAVPDLFKDIVQHLVPYARHSDFVRQLLHLLQSKSTHAMHALLTALVDLGDRTYRQVVRPLYTQLRQGGYDTGPIDRRNPTECWQRDNAPPLGHYRTLSETRIAALQ